MAKIKIEEITNILESEGWKIISEEYQNLDTILEFQCSEGHQVFTTWNKLRAKRECPICKQNIFKENKPVLIEKKKDKTRTFALDQASHKTGWSVFDGKELIKYGVFETKSQDEVERFHEVKEWLISMINIWQPNIVGLEGIQYQANMGVTTFQTLARLQGILMDTCFELKINYKICPTNTWRAHHEVKGRSRADKKKSMQLLIKKWFDISVTDDEADAIGIGKYVADTLNSQIEIINWE